MLTQASTWKQIKILDLKCSCNFIHTIDRDNKQPNSKVILVFTKYKKEQMDCLTFTNM